MLGQATALALLAEDVTDQALKASLEGIVSTLKALAASLASLEALSSSRVKRASTGRHNATQC